MRTARRSILILAATALTGVAEAQAQASFSVSIGAGPLFAGVSLGVGSHYDEGSVFVGAGFGTAHPAYAGGYAAYAGPVQPCGEAACWWPPPW